MAGRRRRSTRNWQTWSDNSARTTNGSEPTGRDGRGRDHILHPVLRGALTTIAATPRRGRTPTKLVASQRATAIPRTNARRKKIARLGTHGSPAGRTRTTGQSTRRGSSGMVGILLRGGITTARGRAYWDQRELDHRLLC